MSNTSLASRRKKRQQRGIALFLERGEEIEHVEGWRWRVPSCSGSFASAYLVDLRAESCQCPDTPPEGEICKHITAATIARAKSEECGGCLKKAGLAGQSFTFHSLRHTFGTALFKRGEHPKIVQSLLGHASIVQTMDTYSHMLEDIGGDAVSGLDEAFG